MEGSEEIAQICAPCYDGEFFYLGEEIKGSEIIPEQMTTVYDGDYVQFKWCTSCGQIQGEWTKKS